MSKYSLNNNMKSIEILKDYWIFPKNAGLDALLDSINFADIEKYVRNKKLKNLNKNV